MTTTEIAEEHGVSRQSIHTYRRTGVFPQPVEGEGSTRPRFRADEVAAFFAANPKQPGVKRSPHPKQRGEPVTTTTARDRLVETLKSPGLVGLDDEEAEELVDAYRASVLRWAADAAAALDRRKVGVEADTIKDAWEEGRDAGADELRRLADEAEASDG